MLLKRSIPLPPDVPALQIEGLSKSFGQVQAVKDFNLEIRQGEILGLLGPNSAGKSTTINMITGVTRIGKGRIRVFGYDNQKQYPLTRRLTGVMHQELVIDNFFRIERGLKLQAGYYGVPDDPAWRETLIERLGLRPHLKKVMTELSGGTKRRYMIAKALIHKPPFLILDEPTAGVDVELRKALWHFIEEINRQGTTVLLTTHYLEEAEQMCHRVGIMSHGELLTLETVSNLTAQLEDRKLIITLTAPTRDLPPGLEPFSATLDPGGNHLVLTLNKQQELNEILDHLHQSQLSIRDIRSESLGLEEVFLQLTHSDAPERRP